MTQEYGKIANGIVLWLACAPGVLWVCAAAGIFLRRSLKDGARMGLTREQIRKGIRGASIASVGPCLVMLSSMLSLMVITGSPIAWLRVNVIGGVGYEIMGASFAADAMHIKIGTSQMSVDYLCVATVVMTTGCLGWILFGVLFSDKMDKVNQVMAGGSKAMIPIVGACCVLGCYSNLVLERATPFGPGTVAAVSAGALMILIQLAARRWKKRWLKDWALSIAMIAGMIASMAVH